MTPRGSHEVFRSYFEIAGASNVIDRGSYEAIRTFDEISSPELPANSLEFLWADSRVSVEVFRAAEKVPRISNELFFHEFSQFSHKVSKASNEVLRVSDKLYKASHAASKNI